MNNNSTPVPSRSFNRGLVGAGIGGLSGTIGFLFARVIVAQFRGTTPWILPVAVVGVLAFALISVLVALPLVSRRAQQSNKALERSRDE